MIDMIDIHMHILPGIDDGAVDWEETLQLARAAVQEGITAVVATPHHANGRYLNTAKDVVQLTEYVGKKLSGEGIPLKSRHGYPVLLIW